MTGVVHVVVVALAGTASSFAAGIIAANAANDDGNLPMVAANAANNDGNLPMVEDASDTGKNGREFLIQQFDLVALMMGVACCNSNNEQWLV